MILDRSFRLLIDAEELTANIDKFIEESSSDLLVDHATIATYEG